MEAAEASGGISSQKPGGKRSSARTRSTRSNTSLSADGTDSEAGTRIPVNEDFLFDVDVEKRELAPVYWLGPVYEGNTMRPYFSLRPKAHQR